MSDAPTKDMDNYIAEQANLDVLRFITCGSVDDGKSTLIGRMLYESKALFDDQAEALAVDSKKQGTQGGAIDYALLVDGLAAEREQGITIDVAYRYFNTDRRKFIVADTPGHEQYTRNMVTGASTADLAIILVDASLGLLTQTRRHSFITSLLGIRNVVLAINKMDLVDYSQTVYDDIVAEYQEFAAKLTFTNVVPVPLSALKGANVIERSADTPWYQGPTLIGYLETVQVRQSPTGRPFRFPVQWVNRPNSDFRGYAGTIVSGVVAKGDAVRVLPSGALANVKEILLYKDSLACGVADQAVTITLDKELDISRGDLLVCADDPCEVSDQFDVTVVWMNEEEGFVGRPYWIMSNGVRINGTLSDIKFKYDVNTLGELPTRTLALNEIGRATLNLDRPIGFEPYDQNPTMGSFVLIDRYTNATVGAGMVNFALRRASNVHIQALTIDKVAREKLNGHKGKVFWFTGLSGSGKSTISNAAEQALYARGIRTYTLDGDNVRHGLNKDLGFTEADRIENIRRVAEVAKLMVDAGIVVLTSFISPFRSERDMARMLFEADEFVEVFVDVPLAVAEQRDPKGLYKKARSGELPNFTGIDSSYEAPENAELVLATDELSVEQCVERILKNI